MRSSSASCPEAPRRARVERARPLLGTVVSLRVEGPAARIDAAIDAAFAAIAAVQRGMSFHDPDSELSRLNREGARVPQPVGAALWRVLRASLALARASDGRFDPSIGGRLVQWRQLPAPADIGAIDLAADWRDVELGRDRRVRFRRPLWLDLGGIAKGHAVDRAVAALRAAGMDAGIVNAGGDLRAFGGALETIRVRDPAAPASARPLLQLRNGAVATSAGYFSAATVDGVARTALVDTRHDASLGEGMSVTVCAPRALWADALTKIVLADAEAARPLLRRLRAEAVVFDRDGRARRLQ
jgi:thiamine biosynthesis lipoprotein